MKRKSLFSIRSRAAAAERDLMAMPCDRIDSNGCPRRMHIALNAQLLSFAETYRSGGISRVIYHLLAELGRDSRGHTFDVFVPTAPATKGWGKLCFHPSGSHTVRPAVRIAWEQTMLPRQLAALKPRPDLLHGL